MVLSCFHIITELRSVNDKYSAKVGSGSASEKMLLDLAWKVDDLSRLSSSGRSLLMEIMCVTELLQSLNLDVVSSNIARRLTKLQERLKGFVKGKYLHDCNNIPCRTLNICPHVRTLQE